MNVNRLDVKGMKIRSSYVWAGVIALLLTTWMISGAFEGGAGSQSTDEGEETSSEELFSVRAVQMNAISHPVTIAVRGRTEALRAVSVRAETSGTVKGLPVEKGTFVKEGDLLCELSLDARDAQMSEAKAIMKQRRLEWEAAQRLTKQGHRSETQSAASEAAYASAHANFKRMEKEFNNTQIRAPFDGIFNDRQVEIGDFVQRGQVCGVLISQDPFLVVGEISEKNIKAIRPGMPGHAKLVTGESISGTVRFISTSASPATRTFRVELEVSNPDTLLRNGVTADLEFEVGAVNAHLLSPAVLGLDDKGAVGVRTVNAKNEVAFYPVTILEDASEGVWVTGLPDQVTVITAGQEMVVPGQKVDVKLDDRVASSM